MGGCSGISFVEPNPRITPPQEKLISQQDTVLAVKTEIKDSVRTEEYPDTLRIWDNLDSLDFSLVFDDSIDSSKNLDSELSEKISKEQNKSANTAFLNSNPDFDKITMPTNKVRVLIKKDLKKIIIYSLDKLKLNNGEKTFRGRISIKYLASSNKISIDVNKHLFTVAMPCSLMSLNDNNYLEIDNNLNLRGSVIITSANKNKGFKLINYLDVEDYLRGVVPLEIGKRDISVIEAVKAQAVAARTYTYKRILERKSADYDLVSSVADQVYGGVDAENNISNQAILSTANIVIVYGDSVINAYYHSTCGGHTANIEDVWDKPYLPYLRSVSDISDNGKAYCSSSKYFSWTEKWPLIKFTDILRKYSPKVFPKKSKYKGSLKSVTVKKRYSCGRVKECVFNSNLGSYKYGSDKIRFLMRRNVAGNPILRSSNFKVISVSGRGVTIHGFGYGHGVGMCQVGALGRAKDGQKYEDILKVYYTGVSLRKVSFVSTF